MVAFGNLNMLLRQLVNKARWQSRIPLAMRATITGKGNGRTLFGAGDAYIGEAAFFFQAFCAAFIEAALMGKQALFPAGQEDGFKLQAFGGM